MTTAIGSDSTLYVNGNSEEELRALLGESGSAVVYGWGHAKYTLVGDALRERGIAVFDCSIGKDDEIKAIEQDIEQVRGMINGLDPTDVDQAEEIKEYEDYIVTKEQEKEEKVKRITHHGRKVHQIDSKLHEVDDADGVKKSRRTCKAGIVNTVLENYRLSKEGKPLLPLVFCNDIEGNRHPEASESEGIFDAGSGYVSSSELRRIYKICYSEQVPEEIREVAKRTFKFVKVSCSEGKQVTKSRKKMPRAVFLDLKEIDSPFKGISDIKAVTRTARNLESLTSKKPWILEVEEKMRVIDQELINPT